MAGMVLRKTGVVLLTILKWILQAALVALKLVLLPIFFDLKLL